MNARTHTRTHPHTHPPATSHQDYDSTKLDLVFLNASHLATKAKFLLAYIYSCMCDFGNQLDPFGNHDSTIFMHTHSCTHSYHIRFELNPGKFTEDGFEVRIGVGHVPVSCLRAQTHAQTNTHTRGWLRVNACRSF